MTGEEFAAEALGFQKRLARVERDIAARRQAIAEEATALYEEHAGLLQDPSPLR